LAVRSRSSSRAAVAVGGAQPLLQPRRDARRERPLQQPVVGDLRAGVELVALEEAEAQRQRRVVQREARRLGRVADGGEGLGQRGRVAAAGGRQRGDGVLQCRQLGLDVGDVALVAHIAEAPADQQRQRDEAECGKAGQAQPRVAPLDLGVLPDEALLDEDDLAQQMVQKVALALGRGWRREAPLDAEGAGQRAEHAVDGRAFLRAAGEVDAAQARGFVQRAAAAEDGFEVAAEQALQAAELLREGKDDRALERVALGLHALDEALAQALLQRRELAAEVGHDLLTRLGGEREGEAEDLVALLLAHGAEGLVEAGQQVALGDHHVDRHLHAQALLQLLHAPAHARGLLLALVGRQGQQVLHAHRQQHAVDGAARARTAQQVEEGVPGGRVGLLVGVLRRVAAGGVDEDGLVAEPPFAVARAAHAAHAGLAELVGEREVQTRVQQRRRLARTRRADEDIPGQLVERAAAAEQALLGARRLLQQADGLAEALLQHGLLLGRGRGAAAHALDELGVDAAPAHQRPREPQAAQQPDDGQHDPAREAGVQRPVLAEGDQRADPPDQGRDDQQAEHAQRDRMEQDGQEFLHDQRPS